MEAEGEIEGEADGDYEDGMQEGEEEVETGEEEVHTVDEEDDNDVVIVGKVTCQTVFYLDQMHELGITRVLPDFSITLYKSKTYPAILKGSVSFATNKFYFGR